MSITGDDIIKINGLFQEQLEPLRGDIGTLSIKVDNLSAEIHDRGERLATVEQKVINSDCGGHSIKLADLQTDVNHAHGGVIRNRYWIFISLISILAALMGAFFYLKT